MPGAGVHEEGLTAAVHHHHEGHAHLERPVGGPHRSRCRAAVARLLDQGGSSNFFFKKAMRLFLKKLIIFKIEIDQLVLN